MILVGIQTRSPNVDNFLARKKQRSEDNETLKRLDGSQRFSFHGLFLQSETSHNSTVLKFTRHVRSTEASLPAVRQKVNCSYLLYSISSIPCVSKGYQRAS